MHIKQWLQEPLQKRQCEMIIDETLWKLGKTVEKEVKEDFYQQLLDLEYPVKFEINFARNIAGAVARSIALQNTINSEGKIIIGYNHELASILLIQNLQTLIREKYATI